MHPNYWETENHIGVSLYTRFLEHCKWITIQVSDIERYNQTVDSKKYVVVLFGQEFLFEHIQNVLTDTKHQWLFIHDQSMEVNQTVDGERNLFGDQSSYIAGYHKSKGDSKSDVQWNHIVMTLTPMWKKDLVLWLKEMFVLSKETYELGEYADIKATLEWIDNFESLLQSLALLCKFGPQVCRLRRYAKS